MLRPLLGLTERDLERGLLRKERGALEAGRTTCADLRPDPARGRDDPSLRAPRGGLRAVSRAPPHGPRALGLMHHSEHGQTVRRAPGRLTAARRGPAASAGGPGHGRDDDRAPPRGSLRLPRGHRQPRGVLRPLPGRLAADARGSRRRGRRRAVPPQATLNRFPWADVTFVEVQRPRRIVEAGRAGKFQPHPHARRLGLEPGSGGTTRVRFTFEASRSCSPTACWRASARAGGSSAARARP